MDNSVKNIAEPRKYEVEEVLGVAQGTLDKVRDLFWRVQDIQLVYTGDRPQIAVTSCPPPSITGGACGEIMSILREIDGYAGRMGNVLSNF